MDGVGGRGDPGEDGVLLRVRAITKQFGAVTALAGFDLDVHHGDFLALLGPSGCGKTTALRVISGLERAAEGQVWVAGRCLAGPGVWVPPERRRIGLVFQDYALFPHLDVQANVGFGLDGLDRTVRDRRVREVLELVGLEGFQHRMPHELSGGQQQRVALARALAPSPAIILLDEPFSNLDAALRSRVRSEVRAVLRAAGATAVFVTHDQEEALAISDRVAVMAEGRVLQVGTPQRVYEAPASPEVARLLGQTNFLSGRIHRGTLATSLGTFPAPGLPDGPVELVLRPECIRVEPAANGDSRVEGVEFYGHDQVVRVRLSDDTVVEVRQFEPLPELAIGYTVRVHVTGNPHMFARAGARSPHATLEQDISK